MGLQIWTLAAKAGLQTGTLAKAGLHIVTLAATADYTADRDTGSYSRLYSR